MRISYSKASIRNESVFSCRATSWPVILVIILFSIVGSMEEYDHDEMTNDERLV